MIRIIKQRDKYLNKKQRDKNLNYKIQKHQILEYQKYQNIQSKMMKQQQRVIKKGDYYEIQTSQQTIMLISKNKKQQTSTSNTNIQTSQYILNQIPSFTQARNQYSTNYLLNSTYTNKGLNQLIDQLLYILNNQSQSLNDQDRKQIQMLIEEISDFKNNQQINLNQLKNKSTSQSNSKQIVKQSQSTTINLTVKYNIKSLSERIDKLQSLDFPDLIALEHQLQIMLGEKKPLQSLQLSHMDEKQKQELNNLYNHLNSLSIMNNTQRVIQSIALNEGKHIQMQTWLEKMQKIQGLNGDLLMELKQDQQIINKLQKNFQSNIQQVREILKQLKGK